MYPAVLGVAGVAGGLGGGEESSAAGRLVGGGMRSGEPSEEGCPLRPAVGVVILPDDVGILLALLA